MTHALATALAPFKFDDEREFDQGQFKVTLRHFTMSNPTIRAAVERVQRLQRRRANKGKLELDEDVKLFCDVALVSWTLKDDKGKAVPIEAAPDVFLGTGQTDPSIVRAGNQLYFNLIEIARDPEAFGIDTETGDQAEAKN